LGDRVHAEVDAAEVHNVGQFGEDLFAGDRQRCAVQVLASIQRGVFVDLVGAYVEVNVVLAIDAIAVADLEVDGPRDDVARG